MDGDDVMREDMVVDLDLNLEPASSGVGFGPFLSQPASSGVGFGPFLSQTADGQIEDRIRQLEAVTARARQRQRWRQARNPPQEMGNIIAFEPRGFVGIQSGVLNGEDNAVRLGRMVERGKSCKRDNSHLVARALEMDLDVKKEVGDGGSFYDCNICLDMAKEPILTCCGHLFCWACFYQLPYVYSTAKECPVCKGEVIDANITPIYGNANDTHLSETESGLKIPPRPPAHRIESVRQQRVNRRISHIPVAEALRRIRIGIGATAEQPRQQDVDSATADQPMQQDLNNATSASDTSSLMWPNPEAGSSRRLRSRQFSRVLSESAASLSSISSALNNAERLVEDLETYIHGRLLRRTNAEFIPFNGGDLLSNSLAVIQTELQNVDSTTGTNFAVSLPSSSGLPDASAASLPLENPETSAADAGNLTVTHPSSSRRRSGASRASDVAIELSRELRRRRLR